MGFSIVAAFARRENGIAATYEQTTELLRSEHGNVMSRPEGEEATDRNEETEVKEIQAPPVQLSTELDSSDSGEKFSDLPSKNPRIQAAAEKNLIQGFRQLQKKI